MKYKRIRELREDHDRKQKEIADILNISQQQYSLYENGNRDIKTEQIIKLCLFYNVSADYILGLPKGMPYPDRWENRSMWGDYPRITIRGSIPQTVRAIQK